jgi:predicted Zn-dependent protease
MGLPPVGVPGADSAAALAGHEAALAIDPNSVVNLWLSAVRLGDFGRHDEAVPRLRRAVDLTQRAPLLVGLYVRGLALAGQREEALAARAELVTQAQREYVGPAAMLMTIALDVDDEAAAAATIHANVDAMTGPVTIATTVVRELMPLLDHPRLGPLIRRLTLWAARS